MQYLSKELLIEAFEYLGKLLHDNELQCKICLYGGSALLFISDFQKMTKDVDYRIIEVNLKTKESNISNLFTLLTMEVAEKMHFDIDWMNTAVEIFASKNEEYLYNKSFYNNSLTVITPTLECLLAMKCISLREDKDINDITNILKKLNLYSTKQVIDIVKYFYPNRDISFEMIEKINNIFTRGKNGSSSEQIVKRSCSGM